MKGIPEQQQIDHWLQVSLDGIQETEEDLTSGYYEEENIPLQSVYTGFTLDYASLGRARFLNDESLEKVREEFSKGARYMLKNFTIAYDKNDPDYLGDKWPPKNPNYTGLPGSIIDAKWKSPGHGQVAWGEVSETYFIDGINCALMAADFDLAEQLAGYFQDSPDGYTMDYVANNYAHALAEILTGKLNQAYQRLQEQLDEYNKHPSTGIHYMSLAMTLKGILDKDDAVFNEGLLLQLKEYQGYAKGVAKNTDEGYICDYAVALANLGIHNGLDITIKHDTLPTGLLLNNS